VNVIVSPLAATNSMTGKRTDRFLWWDTTVPRARLPKIMRQTRTPLLTHNHPAIQATDKAAIASKYDTLSYSLSTPDADLLLACCRPDLCLAQSGKRLSLFLGFP
jgi:hypothetical protein